MVSFSHGQLTLTPEGLTVQPAHPRRTMTTIKISDGIIKDDILVVGVSIKTAKGSLQIESGDLALETKALLASLNDLGATGKSDEVILIPGTNTRLIAFTGLGKAESVYNDEVLRRAAGAAALAARRRGSGAPGARAGLAEALRRGDAHGGPLRQPRLLRAHV